MKIKFRPGAFFKNTWDLLKASGKGFAEDKVPKLSSSLAYCTVFAIVPLLTIIIAAGSLIFSEDAVTGKLFGELSGIVGTKVAADIQDFVKNASLSGKSNVALIIGIVSLFIGSTAVFTEIQDSLNQIWEVKAVPKKGWKKFIQNRLLSFSLIISLGFLLMVTLVLSSLLSVLQTQLERIIPFDSVLLFQGITFIITFIIITFLFAVIFKILPDVEMKWKPAIVGASFTAILFIIGKFLIQLYLSKSNTGMVFGTAGSIMLFLLWIYYTSFILYFGAEFTQAYAEKFSSGIKPSKFAVHLKIIEEEKDVAHLPAQHPEETKN